MRKELRQWDLVSNRAAVLSKRKFLQNLSHSVKIAQDLEKRYESQRKSEPKKMLKSNKILIFLQVGSRCMGLGKGNNYECKVNQRERSTGSKSVGCPSPLSFVSITIQENKAKIIAASQHNFCYTKFVRMMMMQST